MALFFSPLSAGRRRAGSALAAILLLAGVAVAPISSVRAADHRFGGRGFAGHGFAGRGFYGHGFYGRGWYRPGFGVGVGFGYGYGYYGWPYYPAYYGYPSYYAPYPYPSYAPAAVYAPPPPPRPAMAPQTRQFTVYFQFDRYELTASARQVVDAAVAAARSGGPARIEVVGNTDLAGTGRYNQVLSRRRAEAVRTYMVAHGIDPGLIGIRALGKTDPAVRTADGVREPRNRRVEIVIHPLGGNSPGATSRRPPYSYGRPYAPANASIAPPAYGGPPPNGAEPQAGPPTDLVNP